MGIGVSLDYVDCEKVFVIVNELESKKEVAVKSIIFNGTSGAGITFRNLEPMSYNIIVQRQRDSGRIETITATTLQYGVKKVSDYQIVIISLPD